MIGQVLDGLVLVLAVILNPWSKRVAQRGEQASHDGVRGGEIDDSGGGGGGAGGTVMAVMPATGVQENK